MQQHRDEYPGPVLAVGAVDEQWRTSLQLPSTELDRMAKQGGVVVLVEWSSGSVVHWSIGPLVQSPRDFRMQEFRVEESLHQADHAHICEAQALTVTLSLTLTLTHQDEHVHIGKADVAEEDGTALVGAAGEEGTHPARGRQLLAQAEPDQLGKEPWPRLCTLHEGSSHGLLGEDRCMERERLLVERQPPGARVLFGIVLRAQVDDRAGT